VARRAGSGRAVAIAEAQRMEEAVGQARVKLPIRRCRRATGRAAGGRRRQARRGSLGADAARPLRCRRHARDEPAADGFDGALGRLVAGAASARLVGKWKRLDLWADDRGRRAIYDDSPSATRRWRTARCGNRFNARTFRRRKKGRKLIRGW